jgi:hypothetical protein
MSVDPRDVTHIANLVLAEAPTIQLGSARFNASRSRK